MDSGTSSNDRPTRLVSWAASGQDVAERRAQAQRLEGARIASVRYVNLEYSRDALHPYFTALAQTIESRDELTDPTWEYEGCGRFADMVRTGLA